MRTRAAAVALTRHRVTAGRGGSGGRAPAAEPLASTISGSKGTLSVV